MRPHLKLQQELFLFFLIERLSSPAGTNSRGFKIDVDEEGNISLVHTTKENSDSRHIEIRSASPSIYARSNKGAGSDYTPVSPEVRELLLECLLQCARIPTFMVDLWFNYDCDLSCGDLFEETIQFLSKVGRFFFLLISI